ncbi:MAG TPA: ABC transporter substrate-binding protein [Candidatus Polarisedimenticolaceae bacterium]|nr:ABC transporter substrate-binding protein [Candidatus Polarisedimenticolaceae bacterium]
MNKKILFAAMIIFTFASLGVVTAQPTAKVARIGILADFVTPQLDALRQGLRDLGYIEGQNLFIEYRYSEGRHERVPELVSDLLGRKIDLILTSGPTTPTAAKIIKGVPVVFSISGDPVEAGLVASLARPGGNMTGMTFFASVLAGKRVELLKEAVPGTARIGVLANPNHAGESLEFRETETAAKAMSVSIQRHTAQAADDFAGAFNAIAKQRATAIITFPDALMLAHRKEIAEFAVKLRVASVGGWSQFADAGGLMTYGPNLFNSFKRLAFYIDKILKGTKPADLPVEQPTNLELVVNLNTAKQIGLSIPPTVLARADRVIR